MYVKTAIRRTKDGQEIRYLQLAHNEWDADAQRSRTKVLHSFGRADQLDRAAIERLVVSLGRLLDPDRAATLSARPGLDFLEARPLGGTHVLDGLWRRLGIAATMTRLLSGRRMGARAERALFALVANRALAPSSKLAATEWISADVHIDGLADIDEQACYRAMDWLAEIEPDLAKEVYFQVTDLLNLEVDLIFFDTTSTYFETGQADEAIARDERGHRLDQPATSSAGRDRDEDDPEDGQKVQLRGFRSYGKSKDSRPDLPQVVVGMAVTREGIPVRVWSWPGSTGDSALIRQVRDDLREWTLSKVIYVADRGFSSTKNRRHLMRGGTGYIIGEKLRSGTAEAKAALSRQGRYAAVADNLQVKEVKIGSQDRFIICYNPEAAVRDAAVREQLLAQLTEMIDGTDKLRATKRAELAGVISTKPGLHRFLRTTPGGLLRIDRAKVERETNLDGKYLLRCSDPSLSPEDVALGYKQLLEVERGWRDMKSIIDLRPVYHRREDRIRAHVLLCWLALLLIRVAENAAGQTWTTMRAELQRLHAITYTGPSGTFRQTTELTKPQRDLLAALGVPAPKKILDLAVAD
ncbi:IS1634 family transposase [Nonomuraea sp. NPDC048916]|uniref:IS1634 family transposase n=1 Tax=Nonomuraea sp. NPDC048916 TaxID=3154232 RepID=UPI0033E78ED1